MTDSLNRLERELSAMRPRAFAEELVDRIESRLAPPRRRWADASLLSAMSAGVIAACVIAVILLSEPTGALPALPAPHASAEAPRFGDSPLLLARVDLKPFKLTENP